MKQRYKMLALVLLFSLGLTSHSHAATSTTTSNDNTAKTALDQQSSAEKSKQAQKKALKDQREMIKDAVVYVNVVSRTYNTLSPWNSNTLRGSGSGLIIDGGLILTNAHVAADATFMEVQRHGETKRHEADVIFISHEADLALLRPRDAELYKDITPLELGELPSMQQDVEVYGFPIGGSTLSVTRGVVSRIEKQNYAHTGENLIAVQVDAAINFGNSGGPVVSDGKVVGVAMQSGFFTENIGYMIPTPIIRHFLKDIEDGKKDGFGFPGFLAQSLDNPALRRKYGMEEEQTGILAYKIYDESPAAKQMKIGDIITHIDGYKIENSGAVEFRPGEYIDYTHYIDLHQIHEDMKLSIIRDGKAQEVALTLDKPGQEYLLVKPNQYDKQPRYYIYGGFVFMPLNQDVLDRLDPAPPALAALKYEAPSDKLEEVVLMVRVLPADINKDYHKVHNLMITKVNGDSFTNFTDFFDKMRAASTDFVVLESDDGYQLVIDRQEAENKQPDILARYGINSDRSRDLPDAQPATKQAADGNDKDASAETSSNEHIAVEQPAKI